MSWARLTIIDQCPAKSLWVVCLQNVEHASALAHGRVLAIARVLVVDQERHALLSRWQQINHFLQHKHQMCRLPIAMGLEICVLLPGIEEQAWSAVDVEAHDRLLASLILRRDIIGGELGAETEFSLPYESRLQSVCGLWYMPFCCAQVAKKAFPRQPYPIRIIDRFRRSAMCSSRGYLSPALDLPQQISILRLLLRGKLSCRFRLAGRQWLGYWFRDWFCWGEVFLRWFGG